MLAKTTRLPTWQSCADVGVGHEQIVAADPGHATPLGGTAVDGAELPELVAVADLQPHLLAVELEVLGIEADGRLGVDAVLPADPRRAIDLGARSDLGAVADLDARSDHREGTHSDALAEPGGGIDHGQGMDQGHGAPRRSDRPALRDLTP